MTGQKLTFRPMSEADVAVLHDWLHRPHVAQWWAGDDFATLTATREKYLPRIDDDSPVKGYIALLDGAPIGFIQSYVALGCGDGWWEGETDPGVRGIDQFLGDGDSLGKGLGTRLVAAFLRKLFEDPDVTRVQTDPAPDNVRAIRCYEKAGFRAIGPIVTPNGPALYMVAERPRAENRCPLCGSRNECAPARSGSFDTPCWCATVTIDPEALASIPPELRGRACLCVRCATGKGKA